MARFKQVLHPRWTILIALFHEMNHRPFLMGCEVDFYGGVVATGVRGPLEHETFRPAGFEYRATIFAGIPIWTVVFPSKLDTATGFRFDLGPLRKPSIEACCTGDGIISPFRRNFH